MAKQQKTKDADVCALDEMSVKELIAYARAMGLGNPERWAGDYFFISAADRAQWIALDGEDVRHLWLPMCEVLAAWRAFAAGFANYFLSNTDTDFVPPEARRRMRRKKRRAR